MGIVAQLLGMATLPARDVNDERWWSGLGPMTSSGMTVTTDTAMRVSTVWACVRLLSEVVASLPLPIYRRLADGGRERAPQHPLYELLHGQPNPSMTAFEFKELLTSHAILRGDGYAEIVPGPRGFADQLIPMQPDRVRVEKLKNGQLRYRYRQDDNTERILNADQVFHLRGLSWNGMNGVSVIEYGRESFGLALAAEGYGSRFFGNDSRPGGILSKKDGKLSPGAAQRLKAEWEALHRGVGGSHRVAVLEEGLEWTQVGLSPEDAQFLQTREFQAEDVCRWFRVPPHMVGLTSKATSWGSGIEQLSIGFVTYTLLPWLTRWQQAIDRDLIIANDNYFAEFVVDALLRGDTLSRYQAHGMARQWGWASANDIRAMENQNPIPGGDLYLQPANMTPVGSTLSLAERAEAAGQLVRAGYKADAAAAVVGLPPMADWNLPSVTVQSLNREQASSAPEEEQDE